MNIHIRLNPEHRHQCNLGMARTRGQDITNKVTERTTSTKQNSYALPESARDEERAANTGRRNEQRDVQPESARDEERAANTGRRSEQRDVLPKSARDEERAANTGRRNEQRDVQPESAREVERAANTGRRSEQRDVLPESARDEERGVNHNTKHILLHRVSAGTRWSLLLFIIIILFVFQLVSTLLFHQ